MSKAELARKRVQDMHDLHLYDSVEKRCITIQNLIASDPNYSGWDTRLLQEAKLESAQPGKTVYTLTVQPFMANKAGNLHGGCGTTLLDNLSSTAIVTMAKEGFMDWGTVSRTLQMAFLRAVPIGTKCRVVCETVTLGKKLAHCKAQLELMDGTVCVTCTHDKAVLPKPKL